MIEKSINDLEFIDSTSPLPTIEIDIDSIPEEYFGYGDIVGNSLKIFAEKNKKIDASIYVYQGMSVNFHDNTFSAFFGVDSKKNIEIIDHLLIEFKKIKEIKARLSDYIMASDSLLEFHVENGTVWRPADAETWYAVSEKIEGTSSSKEDAPFKKTENDDDIITDGVFEGKTGWIQASDAQKIEKAIIRNNGLEIVIEFDSENTLYTAKLERTIDNNTYKGQFFGRSGGNTYTGTAYCRLFKSDDDTILLGRWIEDGITYYWWAEIYERE